MNLDEIVLRNVMSVEEAELVHNPSSSSPSAATDSLFLGKRSKDVELQPDPMADVSASAEGMDWMDYQRTLLIDSKLPVSQAVYNHGSVPDIGGYNTQAMSMTTSASSNSDFQEGNCRRKRRQVDDIKEKTIERRQRRMIKNRESAARSRARKQAYTNQLEYEVKCLRKTNSWLRKQEASTSITACRSTRQFYFIQVLRNYSFLFFFRKQKDYFLQIQFQCRDTNCGAPARPSSSF